MNKTPEEMAEEFADLCVSDAYYAPLKDGFLAGYQAAKDEDQAKMQELKANWKFCCENKARLLNELAVAERAKDQLADVSKVMPQWISVKDRLPEETLENAIVLVWRASWHDYDTVKWKSCGFDDVNPETITHWQPLPEPPKEEK